LAHRICGLALLSTRLHPLRCALAPAGTVAYAEQPDRAAAILSGKFRGMFCSPESNYISGQVIVAGGGLLI
jgi:hypothetical protein